MNLRKPTGHVHTTNETHGGYSTEPCWLWVAYGPRGSSSGVESSAEEAVVKASAAAVVLRDGR